MIGQLDMFDAAPERVAFEPRRLARRKDPATSKAAAAAVEQFGGKHHQVILDALRQRGRHGLTFHEIAACCSLDPHAVGRRLGELQRAGLARVLLDNAGNERMRDTPSGRAARVWGLA